MIDKAEIKYRFKRSVESYEEHASVQKVIAEYLFGLLRQQLEYTPAKVLEIGCGTGLLTRKLCRIVDKKSLFVNDLVEEMCRKATANCQLLPEHSLAGDIEEMDIPGLFDLVVSASTFQWLSDPAMTFLKLADHMTRDSLLAFSTFGSQNMIEIQEFTGRGLTYPSCECLKNYLSPYFELLHIEETEHKLYFSDPLDILRHLKNTGVNATNSRQIWTKTRLNQFTLDYMHCFPEQTYPLTYHPIYCICRKKPDYLKPH